MVYFSRIIRLLLLSSVTYGLVGPNAHAVAGVAQVGVVGQENSEGDQESSVVDLKNPAVAKGDEIVQQIDKKLEEWHNHNEEQKNNEQKEEDGNEKKAGADAASTRVIGESDQDESDKKIEQPIQPEATPTELPTSNAEVAPKADVTHAAEEAAKEEKAIDAEAAQRTAIAQPTNEAAVAPAPSPTTNVTPDEPKPLSEQPIQPEATPTELPTSNAEVAPKAAVTHAAEDAAKEEKAIDAEAAQSTAIAQPANGAAVAPTPSPTTNLTPDLTPDEPKPLSEQPIQPEATPTESPTSNAEVAPKAAVTHAAEDAAKEEKAIDEEAAAQSTAIARPANEAAVAPAPSPTTNLTPDEPKPLSEQPIQPEATPTELPTSNAEVAPKADVTHAAEEAAQEEKAIDAEAAAQSTAIARPLLAPEPQPTITTTQEVVETLSEPVKAMPPSPAEVSLKNLDALAPTAETSDTANGLESRTNDITLTSKKEAGPAPVNFSEKAEIVQTQKTANIEAVSESTPVTKSGTDKATNTSLEQAITEKDATKIHDTLANKANAADRVPGAEREAVAQVVSAEEANALKKDAPVAGHEDQGITTMQNATSTDAPNDVEPPSAETQSVAPDRKENPQAPLQSPSPLKAETKAPSSTLEQEAHANLAPTTATPKKKTKLPRADNTKMPAAIKNTANLNAHKKTAETPASTGESSAGKPEKMSHSVKGPGTKKQASQNSQHKTDRTELKQKRKLSDRTTLPHNTQHKTSATTPPTVTKATATNSSSQSAPTKATGHKKLTDGNATTPPTVTKATATNSRSQSAPTKATGRKKLTDRTTPPTAKKATATNSSSQSAPTKATGHKKLTDRTSGQSALTQNKKSTEQTKNTWKPVG